MNISPATAPQHNKLPLPSKRLRRRHWLFLVLNSSILILVLTGVLTNEFAETGAAVYVSALFLICTAPLIFVSSYRGQASLLLIFLAYYFGTFGLKDLSDLLAYEPTGRAYTDSLFTAGEISIIIGAVCFISGYALTTLLMPKRSSGVLTSEWAQSSIALIGILAWTLGFCITAYWQFGVADRYASSTTTISIVFGGFVSLLRTLQPLGSLLLIYLFLTTKNRMVLVILLATIAADMGLGFLGDSKEIAIRGPLLYLVSVLLMRERIPVVESIIFVVLVGITFSFFASYRDDLHSGHQSRSDALENIESKLDTISGEGIPLAKRLSEGMDYLALRITLKQNMEMILERTGKDIAFQQGNTIAPLLYAFIPRFIAPNKGDSSATGQIFNREFRISPDRDTYISVGHLGEFYWNFGWPGLVIGMMIIGFIMASAATLLRLDVCPTLPKFLILLMTIYLLALRFEGALAMTYTIWARALVMLLLLNALVPKKVSRQSIKPERSVIAPKGARILSRANKS